MARDAFGYEYDEEFENKVFLVERQRCSFCEVLARFDATTIYGQWAYLCPAHYKRFHIGGLGTGIGQVLIYREGS